VSWAVIGVDPVARPMVAACRRWVTVRGELWMGESWTRCCFAVPVIRVPDGSGREDPPKNCNCFKAPVGREIFSTKGLLGQIVLVGVLRSILDDVGGVRSGRRSCTWLVLSRFGMGRKEYKPTTDNDSLCYFYKR
jgi:hypothetical protein